MLFLHLSFKKELFTRNFFFFEPISAIEVTALSVYLNETEFLKNKIKRKKKTF